MRDRLAVQNVSLDPAQWTEITPACGWDHVLIGNDGASTVRLRIDDGDPATELALAPGSERSLVAPKRSNNYTRFPAEAVAFYLKPDSGTGPVHLVWV